MSPPLIVFGCGRVGSAFLSLLEDSGLGLSVHAVVDSTGAVKMPHLRHVIDHKASGRPLSALGARPFQSVPPRAILVDTSGADKSHLWCTTLEQGGAVVTATKQPLAKPEGWHPGWRTAWMDGRLGVGACVGAGVSTASALRQLLLDGDEIDEIRAVVSGTLHDVVHRVREGHTLADAVWRAHDLGYTEPDPALDLSGADVGRKMLILGRLAGFWDCEPPTRIEPFLPEGSVGLDAHQLNLLLTADPLHVTDRIRNDGRCSSGSPVYVGTANRNGIVCGLSNPEGQDALSTLRPDENAVELRTHRFQEKPLQLRGPAFGLNVTAGTLLTDVQAALSALTRA